DADRRAYNLARDVRGVPVASLDAMVIVSGRHEDDRLTVSRLEHARDVRRNQGPASKYAEVDRLEMSKGRVVALDRQRRLVGRYGVAVVERMPGQLLPVVRAELENRDRLVHPAEIRIVLLEDLHHHARPTAIRQQRLARMVEVRVGVVALPHLLDRELEDLRRQPALSACSQLQPTAPVSPDLALCT